MENKNNTHGCGCESEEGNCGGDMRGCRCGEWHGSKHHVAKIIICFIVLAVTFWAGIKIGELKEYLEGGFYGYRMMREYGRSDRAYPEAGMMMGGWSQDNGKASTTGQ